MPLPRGLPRKKALPQSRLVRRPIRPGGAPLIPQGSESILVCDGGLNEERLNALRVRQCETESHWATVVLHEKDIAVEAELLGEMLHDRSDVVERVRKRLRIRRIAMTEPGIVGRHQVI